MKNLLLASVAVIALGAPAFAQTTVTTDADTNATIGATSGGVGGAALGAVLGGPIGAVVGGFAGAVIGAEAGVEASTVEYATANPVDPIYIDGSVDVGFVVSQPVADYAIGNPVGSVTVDGDIVVGTVLPGDVEINAIPDSPTYSYVYVNDRPVLVENSSRTVVWVNN